jgi:hypothetical protein
MPPSPHPVETGEGGFWFASEKLWTRLRADGTWKLGHYSPTDTFFRQKVLWRREGYDWYKGIQPNLRERLDASAPALETDEHANAGWTNDSQHPFLVTGIDIPTLGYWKITGHFENAS